MKLREYFSDINNTFMPNNTTSDVLLCEDKKLLRKHDLKRAAILGTTFNQESSIEYVDKTGRNRVIISKVIGVSEENALLHNNNVIPIKKISRVIV